jgi:hypothetical protein
MPVAGILNTLIQYAWDVATGRPAPVEPERVDEAS